MAPKRDAGVASAAVEQVAGKEEGDSVFLNLFRAAGIVNYGPLVTKLTAAMKAYVPSFAYGSEDDVRLRAHTIAEYLSSRGEWPALSLGAEMPTLVRGCLAHGGPMVRLFQSGVSLCLKTDAARTLLALEGSMLSLDKWAKESEASFKATAPKLLALSAVDVPATLQLSLAVPPPSFAARSALVGGMYLFHAMRQYCFTGSHVAAWRTELGKATATAVKGKDGGLLPPVPEADPHDQVMKNPWCSLFTRTAKNGRVFPGKLYDMCRPVNTAGVDECIDRIDPVHEVLEDAGFIVVNDMLSSINGLKTCGALDSLLAGYIEDLLRTARPVGSTEKGVHRLVAPPPGSAVAGKGKSEHEQAKDYTRNELMKAAIGLINSNRWVASLSNTKARARFRDAFSGLNLQSGEGCSSNEMLLGLLPLSYSLAAMSASSFPTEGENSVKMVHKEGAYSASGTLNLAGLKAGGAMRAHLTEEGAVEAGDPVDGWDVMKKLPSVLFTKLPKPAKGRTPSFTPKALDELTGSQRFSVLRALGSVENAVAAMSDSVAHIDNETEAAVIFPYAAALEFIAVGPLFALRGDPLVLLMRAEITKDLKEKKKDSAWSVLSPANWTDKLADMLESVLGHLAVSATTRWLLRLRETISAAAASGVSFSGLATELVAFADAARTALPPAFPEDVARKHVQIFLTARQRRQAECYKAAAAVRSAGDSDADMRDAAERQLDAVAVKEYASELQAGKLSTIKPLSESALIALAAGMGIVYRSLSPPLGQEAVGAGAGGKRKRESIKEEGGEVIRPSVLRRTDLSVSASVGPTARALASESAGQSSAAAHAMDIDSDVEMTGEELAAYTRYFLADAEDQAAMEAATGRGEDYWSRWQVSKLRTKFDEPIQDVTTRGLTVWDSKVKAMGMPKDAGAKGPGKRKVPAHSLMQTEDDSPDPFEVPKADAALTAKFIAEQENAALNAYRMANGDASLGNVIRRINERQASAPINPSALSTEALAELAGAGKEVSGASQALTLGSASARAPGMGVVAVRSDGGSGRRFWSETATQQFIAVFNELNTGYVYSLWKDMQVRMLADEAVVISRGGKPYMPMKTNASQFKDKHKCLHRAGILEEKYPKPGKGSAVVRARRAAASSSAAEWQDDQDDEPIDDEEDNEAGDDDSHVGEHRSGDRKERSLLNNKK